MTEDIEKAKARSLELTTLGGSDGRPRSAVSEPVVEPVKVEPDRGSARLRGN